MRPVTEWPKPEALLPSDLCPIEQLEAGHFDVKALKARLSTVQATDISRFGRQAQAVSLLDQYLGITRAPAHKQSTVVVSELQQLDCKIQAFLSDTINDDYAKRSLRCAACAICVR